MTGNGEYSIPSNPIVHAKQNSVIIKLLDACNRIEYDIFLVIKKNAAI